MVLAQMGAHVRKCDAKVKRQFQTPEWNRPMLVMYPRVNVPVVHIKDVHTLGSACKGCGVEFPASEPIKLSRYQQLKRKQPSYHPR